MHPESSRICSWIVIGTGRSLKTCAYVFVMFLGVLFNSQNLKLCARHSQRTLFLDWVCPNSIPKNTRKQKRTLESHENQKDAHRQKIDDVILLVVLFAACYVWWVSAKHATMPMPIVHLHFCVFANLADAAGYAKYKSAKLEISRAGQVVATPLRNINLWQLNNW